jgi:hypothetical protein
MSGMRCQVRKLEMKLINRCAKASTDLSLPIPHQLDKNPQSELPCFRRRMSWIKTSYTAQLKSDWTAQRQAQNSKRAVLTPHFQAPSSLCSLYVIVVFAVRIKNVLAFHWKNSSSPDFKSGQEHVVKSIPSFLGGLLWQVAINTDLIIPPQINVINWVDT